MDEGVTRCNLFALAAGGRDPGQGKGGKALSGTPAVKADVASKRNDGKKAKVAQPMVDSAKAARRFEILRSVGEECVTEDDLRALLAKKEEFRLYDGFEPSGRMHIAQGIFKALNVNKCTRSGGKFVFWVADWFALMNDKMGGDLDKIKVVGEYFIEVWKGAGMNLDHVEFRWASDDIINNAKPYWEQMLDISKRFTLTRIKKCCQIMGRLENNLTAAQILYPLMQCTDVFFLKADVCQLGVDQRKVNMLAREYCDSVGRKLKPVVLSHHMLYGLAEGQAKMSKSNPDSAIFMEDTPDEVVRKLSIAYCPKKPSENPKELEGESLSLVEDELKNPCLDYVKHIVMSQPDAVFEAPGGKTFETFEEVRDAFLNDKLSEEDLKSGLATCINKLMQPVRDHFENNAHAKEILDLVRQYKKEDVKPPSRMKRLHGMGDPGQMSVVFAPVPDPEFVHLRLSDILLTRDALNELKKSTVDQIVLFVSDLDAIALNAFSGDKKLKATDGIRAYNEIFLAAVESVTKLDRVQIIFQSEMMLTDPSNYWISVINVGRHFQLQDVHNAVNPEESQAGPIVAALMHVGNMLSLAPKLVVAISDVQERLHNLAMSYIKSCKDQQDCISPPQVTRLPALSTVTSPPEGTGTEVDLFVLDKFAQHVKKKLKQAFCEPGNVEYNPVLGLVNALALTLDESVEIKLQEGGEKTFSDATELETHFKHGIIHPGDLKAAAVHLVEKLYHSLGKSLADVQKSVTIVENYIKRMVKKN